VKNVTAVILAAGESKRMRSEVSKLLHRLGRRCLVEFPAEACFKAGVERIIVVVGHQSDKIKEILGSGYEYIYQEKRLGTGDALRRVIPSISNFKGELLVLPGDAPFVSPFILQKLVHYHREKKPAATILTAFLPDPGAYGRVIRNGYEGVKKIVESKNATPDELKIREINSGIYCFETQKILPLLSLLEPNRITGEVYLTDIFGLLHERGEKIYALAVPDPCVAMGVNTPEELKKAYQILVQRGDLL